MKKLIALGLSLLPLCAMADEVPSLVITKTDKTDLSVAISDIRSIKFQEGNMVILQTNNATQQINVDEISTLSFTDIASAIRSLSSEKTGNQVIVTDLSGRVLFRGTDGDEIPSDIHGNCIVSIDGRSHKVYIR